MRPIRPTRWIAVRSGPTLRLRGRSGLAASHTKFPDTVENMVREESAPRKDAA